MPQPHRTDLPETAALETPAGVLAPLDRPAAGLSCLWSLVAAGADHWTDDRMGDHAVVALASVSAFMFAWAVFAAVSVTCISATHDRLTAQVLGKFEHLTAAYKDRTPDPDAVAEWVDAHRRR